MEGVITTNGEAMMKETGYFVKPFDSHHKFMCG